MSHHAQRVVAVGDIRVKRCTDGALVHIVYAAEGVKQFAIAVFIKTYSHSIDSKVTTILIVLQCAVLYDWVARIMLITLTASTYKLQFYLATLDLGSAVGLEDAEVRPFAEAFGHGLCEVNATAYNHYINVGTLAMQKNIAHITANDIALQAETIGFLAHKVEDRKVYFRVGGKHFWR